MKIIALLLAATLAAPALAQTTTTTTTTTATDPAPPMQAGAQPSSAGGANAGIAADVAVDNAGRQLSNADVRAQYDADLAAYDQAMIDHHRAVRRTDRAYMDQQRAYAGAMAQWRYQTAECKRGVLKMCSLPTPDPANYF